MPIIDVILPVIIIGVPIALVGLAIEYAASSYAKSFMKRLGGSDD